MAPVAALSLPPPCGARNYCHATLKKNQSISLNFLQTVGGFFGVLSCLFVLGMLTAGRHGTSQLAGACEHPGAAEHLSSETRHGRCRLQRPEESVKKKSPLNNALAFTLPEARKGLREAWQSL